MNSNITRKSVVFRLDVCSVSGENLSGSMEPFYNAILLINIVIYHFRDFIDLAFDGSYDKMQLCHTVAK